MGRTRVRGPGLNTIKRGLCETQRGRGRLIAISHPHPVPAVPPATQRFDTIDLLRGLSILAVVLLHASLWLSFSDYTIGRTLPRWLRDVLFNEGGSGVSAFFAISGFLITLISLRRFGSLARLRLITFYRIRFARIFPALALLLLVLSLIQLFGDASARLQPGRGTLGQVLFAALTFHLNWYEAQHGFLPAPWTVLWSLSVEEMFYLVFPILCITLLRVRRTRVLFYATLAFLILFGPFARTPWYTHNDLWSYQSYLGNTDNIALGCLTALLTNHLATRSRFLVSRVPLYSQYLGTLLTLFIVVWDWPRTLFGWQVKRVLGRSGLDTTVLGLGICLIMLGSVLRNRSAPRWTAPIRWLGRYSYEVYLFHEFVVGAVLTLFLRHPKGPVALWIIATALFSAGAGFLLSRLFSEPLNRALRGAPTPAELPPALAQRQTANR